jgi:DNA replication ATP-dependent helicase Dna2
LEIVRIRSGFRDVGTAAKDIQLASGTTSNPDTAALMRRLLTKTGITVVGVTPMQLHSLMTKYDTGASNQLFDLLLIDEASQISVAQTTLYAAAMADGACVVPAGDVKQLAPISKCQAPAGLENYVGSFMAFIEEHHNVTPAALERNYRSNKTIVGVSHVAGYPASLHAASPDLRLDLQPATIAAPAGWPAALPYDAGWADLLDPDRPVTAFIYDDERWSSQWNAFEAQAVASLLVALRLRMQHELLNELDDTGAAKPHAPRTPIDEQHFWEHGVGVVTPHRAQQALVLKELATAFPQDDRALIRGAVDTVERFQGQERDVIVVTYALGDPDAIAEEDEFLMSLNRFNVAASRPRAKLIVLASEQVINHLSSEVDVLHASSLLKSSPAATARRRRRRVCPTRRRRP